MRKEELRLFVIVVLAELLFGLLMIARWGTTFCCGDAAYHHYIPMVVLETGNIKYLGVVWPPLFHLLVMPLLLVEFLYTTGMAGTLVSALATGIMCVFLYRLVSKEGAGLAAPVALLCNIFTLAYGATPMMEQLAMMFMVMTAYYMKEYLERGRVSDLVKASAALSAGCLTRYELWAVTALAVLVFLIRELRLRGYYRLLFLPLPLAGVCIWLAWNYVLAGDPLFFVHPPMGASFYASVYLGQAWLLERVGSMLFMIYAVSGLLLIRVIRHISWAVHRRSYVDLAVAGLLLAPLIFHVILVFCRLSFGWARHFYMALPGMIFCTYRFYRARLASLNLPPSQEFRRVLKPLLSLMLIAYPVQGYIIVVGWLPDFEPRTIAQHRLELMQVAELVKDGTILVGTDAAGWLSAMTGIPPSQIIDGNDPCFRKAVEEPWRYVEFVLIEKLKGDPLLEALNMRHGGKFYIYRYYYDDTWRSEFLKYFHLILETEHYMLFALKD